MPPMYLGRGGVHVVFILWAHVPHALIFLPTVEQTRWSVDWVGRPLRIGGGTKIDPRMARYDIAGVPD